MKQYTTPEQTAKLIKLGFEKPKNRIVKRRFDRSTSSWIVVGEESNYSIGELIEMLGMHLSSIHYIGIVWAVNAKGLQRRSEELIDALYAMILQLKEEGVI